MQSSDQPSSRSVFNVLFGRAKREKLYQQWVTDYHQEVYRFAYWLCQDVDVAQDLVQETFLRAWKAFDNLQDDAAVKSWLFTIVRRENARRFSLKSSQVVHEDVDECILMAEESFTIDVEIDNQKVREKLHSLPIDYREPLILQVMFGYSSEEIGAFLSLNINTVNTRLFRARELLKRKLSGFEE